MTSSTDSRIKELFELAAAAQDQGELKRVAQRLRAAIVEHSRGGASREVSPNIRSVRPSDLDDGPRVAT